MKPQPGTETEGFANRFVIGVLFSGEYSLPQGVFLFLGYSETDESLLKPHSNLTVHDAVMSLQEFLLQEADNGTLCTLSLFNVTRENIILAAKLAGHKSNYNLSPQQLLEQERVSIFQVCYVINKFGPFSGGVRFSFGDN